MNDADHELLLQVVETLNGVLVYLQELRDVDVPPPVDVPSASTESA